MRKALIAHTALWSCVWLATPAAALANPYEVFIDIEREEDLYDLFDQGEISDTTLETLVELLQRGVDINRASREDLYTLPNITYADIDAILAYRDEVGWISDPASLAISGVLTEAKFKSIAAFLLIGERPTRLLDADGWVRTQTRFTIGDDQAPPVALQGRVQTFEHLRAGIATTMTRDRLQSVRYDPTRDALSAKSTAAQFHLPKAYVAWEDDEYAAVAGTFRAGFGQRLTFDISDQITPNGIYPDDQLFRDTDLSRRCRESAGELAETPCPQNGGAGNDFGTPDYRWREGLLGAAAGVKRLRLGPGHLQAYAFTSVQPRSIYQYELYDRSKCSDPRDDNAEIPGNIDCSSPDVFRRQDDVLMETSRFTFSTLPNVYREILYGGNATYHVNRRAHVGVTGYGAMVDFLPDGIDLDFQEWSRYPFGGDWGAVGIDGAYGIGNTDLFAEVTRSFDSQPSGGDFAALVRSVTNWGEREELELSLRYYGQEFANPYARPISAPDEFDGNRARDEYGARARYTGRPAEDLRVRARVDFWSAPSEEAVDALLFARGDYDLSRTWRVALWTQYQNKDIAASGRGQCFEVSVEEDERGEPIPCAGEKYQVAARARFAPSRRWSVSAQYRHEFLDEAATSTRPHFDSEYRQDASATVIVAARPIRPLRLRVRSRYLFEDIKDNGFLEQSLWTYTDVSYRFRKRDRVRLRYDLFMHLDDRQSTMDRSPSPEHWFWLEFESRF